MKMLFLTYRDSLQEVMMAFLADQKIAAYTCVPTVHGVGSSGEAFGAFTSHGENAMVLAALSDEQAQKVITAFRIFRRQMSERQQGARIPAKLIVVPCEEIV